MLTTRSGVSYESRTRTGQIENLLHYHYAKETEALELPKRIKLFSSTWKAEAQSIYHDSIQRGLLSGMPDSNRRL